MMLNRWSLKYRIAATIVALEAVMAAVVLWQTLSMSLDASYGHLANHQDTTLNLLSDQSRIALVTEEYAELQRYLEHVAKEGHVTRVLLADAKGKVVAGTRVVDLGLPLPEMDDSEDRSWNARMISNATGRLGTLAIEFSKAAYQESLREARDRGIAIALAGMIVIALIGVAVGHLLTRRLSVFERAAQRIASGNFDVTTALDGNDEVARLSRSFDQMTRTIQDNVAQLKEANELFTLAVGGTNDGIWDWNVETGVTYFSPRYREIVGCKERDHQHAYRIDSWKERIHPQDREAVTAELQKALDGPEDIFAVEHRLLTKQGGYKWVSVRGKVTRDALGKAARMTGALADITDRKSQEAAILHQALHDSLTGLANRELFKDRLQHATKMAQRHGGRLAVAMMDLDHFKDINDTLGHHAGDMVLTQVATRLRTVLRETDTIARLGGDEFAVLMQEVDELGATTVAQKILRVLEPTFYVEGQELDVAGSIGIALYPSHGESPGSLIKRADVAMYGAKQAKSGYALYDPARDQTSVSRLSLAGDLRRAIQRDELVLHYQPKIDLERGVVCGVEALVRWLHPERGLLGPDKFIPLAEQGGLINALTDWVLQAALQQQAAWKRRGLKLTVSVNLSARSLQDPNLPDRIAERIKACGLTPADLELEITETAIMAEPARAMEILTRLSAMGVTLSVDDYGTGYSSLAYVKRLPVTALKIDRSFVKDMMSDESNAVIVRSTVDLGHNLGRKLVAEGVEDQQTLDLLRALGCDMVQGYYVSKPLPAAELQKWMDSSPWASGKFRVVV